MKVFWSDDKYNGLSFAHTPDETDDETAYVRQPIQPHDLIIHAANLHLMRSMEPTPAGLPLWSVRRNPSRPEPVNAR